MLGWDTGHAMKKQWTLLLTFGFAWGSMAAGTPVQTNEVHQQALDVLRKTMESLEPPPKTDPPVKARPGREADFAEAERLYLQGKMSAKEYRRYLDDHKVDPTKANASDVQNRAIEVLRKEMEKADAGAGPAAAGNPETLAGPEEATLLELEKKMD